MYLFGVLRVAAGEGRDVLRAGTPTHRRLRDRLVAIGLATVGFDVACAVLAFQDALASFAQTHRLGSQRDGHVPPGMLAVTFVLAVYGAYFGAGMSIIMLAFLGILLPDDIQRSNALKGMLALLINAIAVVYFAAFGPVRWGAAAAMAAGAICGGYVGVHFARRLGRRWLKVIVIAYGVIAAVVLLLR